MLNKDKTKERYVIGGPVPGGSSYWEINDTLHNFNVVSVFNKVPNAEKKVRAWAKELNGLKEPSAYV